MPVPPEPLIRTDRLVLVPIRYDAAERIVAGDLSRLACAPGFPHADTLDALAPYVAAGDRTVAGGWWITRTDDGHVIGDCGWRGGPDANGEVEIGYGLAAPSRGQGYGVEAVGGLVGWIGDQPGVVRIVAEVLLDNTPSRRLLERLGFTVTDVIAPHAWYALTPRAGYGGQMAVADSPD